MMDNIGFTFEPFYLNIKKQCLQKNAEDIQTSSRMFKLLLILAETSPAPVSKEQLTSLLWPKTIVSEWSIARLVSDTRTLLGDNGDHQKYIQTVRGIGFCMPNVVSHVQKNNQNKVSKNTFKLIGLSLVILLLGALFYWQDKSSTDFKSSIERISNYQDKTFSAFKAQLQRREQLASMIEKRLNIKRQRQWEMFFSYYHSQMNAEELFICAQIRAITDNGLYKNNQAIFNELSLKPDIFKEIPLSKNLYQHIDFWLTKYHSVFTKRKDMCLLYVGVEDSIPYPSGVDKNIKIWLSSH